MPSRFDQLLAEALAQDFSGWDFSWLRGRWFEEEPSWNYRQLVQNQVGRVRSLLDMGTGGGEFLASLSDLPAVTYATEGYPPNIPIARARLEPLGVSVVSFENDRTLPLPGETFELVINRHESYWVPEVHRILKPGGVFLTQQVGPADCIQLNAFLGAPADADLGRWRLGDEVRPMERLGFRVLRCEEEFLDSVFFDVGAVVFFSR